MKTQFDLTIEKPCKEKFENFTKTNNGGFCNSCNKEVIDFTKMTPQQVIEYFKKPQTSTCGVFNKSQLKTYKENLIPKNRLQFRTFLGLGLSLVSLFSVNSLSAQVNKNPIEIKKNIEKGKVSITNTLKEQIVKGIISDEDEPLPGASILLEGTTIGTVTNFDGEFTFPKPLKKGDVLIISYLGYKTERVIVNEKQLNLKLAFNLELKMDSCITLGAVDVKNVYKTKRSFWKRLTSKK